MLGKMFENIVGEGLDLNFRLIQHGAIIYSFFIKETLARKPITNGSD
jgi:hypothetical protein